VDTANSIPHERWTSVRTDLGEGFDVARALPRKGRRSVGPWCFLDHFGPVRVERSGGMQVGPHPHIGLQTVSWLFEGTVLHRDSLGSVQIIEPGELNLMTAGESGVSHSEHSPPDAPGTLHGVQLWTALPSRTPPIEPCFEHHSSLPRRAVEGASVRVFAGSLGDLHSPAKMWSRAVGAEIALEEGAAFSMDVDVRDEHAVLVVSGSIAGDGPDTMLYFASGAPRLHLRAQEPTRMVLIGGEPRGEPLHMWWNFVAPDRAAIRRAAADWRAGHPRFGSVAGDPGPRIPGPELPAVY
jgi:quercetin 2,3-dioxygenase